MKSRFTVRIAMLIALIFAIAGVSTFGMSKAIQNVAHSYTAEHSIDYIDQAETSVDATTGTYEMAQLIRVVDGDTIVVDRGYGEETVRLIGIDTPESVHPDENRNTEAGNVASDHTKELLADVDTVYLEKDISDTDKYNRLLRYVWLDNPDTADAETAMLNAILVKTGWAEPKDFPPDTTYSELFHSLAN